MNLEERKKAFVELGGVISGLLADNEKVEGNDFKFVLNKAHQKNQWFTPRFVIQSFEAIASWLNKESLDNWLQQYTGKINTNTKEKEIGVIMAGNIPMVGFHDLLSVLISGNKAQAKCASGDEVLLPSYTFIATASAVLAQSAIPVLVDSEMTSMGLDPEAMERERREPAAKRVDVANWTGRQRGGSRSQRKAISFATAEGPKRTYRYRLFTRPQLVGRTGVTQLE